ncbi:2-(R)-hydroxypropyl-CoM dehydrogenase [Colletotrichum gloeosporioides]|uniref:2-(R)-hydroxypropyl-CoM dehydrogenase n=1 Tax=Colletotrichum gloeosporioides TaxID=474922 RepID=A0A8H4FD98_COLGL|nr:2-(R)-hydroxypropyl-CoM dehydrogenase [Colletotrichum gloeosporioides]KAF3798212.1 2-(R)-hydroxypropyl-CoM dehydrogenase [Colletotrichum gloeosporioides]
MTRVVIVTGVSFGLGCAISIAYSNVVCGDLSGQILVGESQTTVGLINEVQLGRAIIVSVDNLISTAVSQYGRLDVMVNNAGISLELYNKLGPKLITETTDATFEKTMAVNMRSVFLGCKYAIRQFMTQLLLTLGSRGWIINTSSVYGLQAEINHVVTHMTKCVALESAPAKIHCNVICPGCKSLSGVLSIDNSINLMIVIRTGMDSNLHSDEATLDATVALHPWGSLGNPGDVAKAAVFLASENAGWITGVSLPVDGGYMVG